MDHPLGCHRPRIPDLVVFEKLVQILVFGCAYWRIADGSCSATTLRRRRDEWIDLGVMDELEEMARESYDRVVGLVGVISEKGKPSPLGATKWWGIERTNYSWSNAHKKMNLVWCTERRGRVIDFWVAFSNVLIILGRLIREAWSRYRWEGRPSRRP